MELTTKQATQEFCGSLGLNFKYVWPRVEAQKIDIRQYLYGLDNEVDTLKRIAFGTKLLASIAK